MNFAVNVPTSCGAGEYSNFPFCDGVSWEKQRDFGTTVESLGYDGLAVPDHLMTGDGATTECVATVMGLAGVTDDAYLYPKTINNTLRHGPFFAKQAATMDAVSGGRLKLGLGAGWKEDEAVAYGYEWPDAPDRLRELEETIRIAKQMWTEDEVSFDGDYYTVENAVCKPRPKQEPHPPIMVGGGGEEFTLRIAAKHADAWNYWGPTDVIEGKLDVLRRHCETYDTSFEDIEISWFTRCIVRETRAEVDDVLELAPRFDQDDDAELDDGDYDYLVGTPAEVVEAMQPYVDLGIDEFVLEFVDFPKTRGAELFAEEVIPELD